MYFYSHTFLLFWGKRKKHKPKIRRYASRILYFGKKKKKPSPSVTDKSSGLLYEYMNAFG